MQPFGHTGHRLKIGGLRSHFWGGESWVPIQHKVAWAETDLHTKWHLDPFSHLAATVHICCSQMAGWIKMPLGMEVGLDPNDFVLDGDPAPQK